MIWLIIIAALAIIPFWLKNRKLYKEWISDPFIPRMVQMYNTLHRTPLEPSENFRDYTANLILKFAIFVVVILIQNAVAAASPFWGTTIVGLYTLALCFARWVYRERGRAFSQMSDEFVPAFFRIYEACQCMPTYQTICYVLMWIGFIITVLVS